MSAAAILARTVDDGGCLIWQGARNSKGYGSMAAGVKGKTQLTHRAVYQLTVGPIPPGLTIDHLCMEKLCLNVQHMEVVTRSENSRRKITAQTRCKRGHELAGGNLRLTHRANGRTHRVCRECARLHNAASKMNVPVTRFFPEQSVNPVTGRAS